MAYLLPVKYFNSFWLKKAVGDDELDPYHEYADCWSGESTVTTHVNGGPNPVSGSSVWYLSTWPGLPWGSRLAAEDPDNAGIWKAYPCFPWGGVSDWTQYTGGKPNSQCLSTTSPFICCQEYPTDQSGTIYKRGGSLTNRVVNWEEGQARNWFVEEARIRGGYNNTSVNLGIRAYIVDDDNDSQQHRFNSLIYSGVFNSRTGINDTNVFNSAENITRSVDPANGSIQKLFAFDSNLDIFQENKCSHALIDKDAIYSAEGGGTVTSSNTVIGQVVPYLGKYGISTNPESFAFYGMRRYLVDRFRSAVLRLSRDGITEISAYGMTDYFRDELSTINNDWIIHSWSATNAEYPTVTANPLSEFINTIYVDNQNAAGCGCEEIPLGATISLNGSDVVNIYVVNNELMTSGPYSGKCQITTNTLFNGSTFGIAPPPFSYPTEVDFIWYLKDKIVGGFDINNKAYVVSLQEVTTEGVCPKVRSEWESQNDSAIPPIVGDYATISFDESINGWVSFYSYPPVWIGSLKNKFYSTNGYKIYQHYVDTISNNRGNFYDKSYPSSIQFIFNEQPSIQKNFQTINYEGSAGWQVDHFYSDATEPNQTPYPLIPISSGVPSWIPSSDVTNPIASYDMGAYINPNTQMPEHSGFYRKENRYVANLINNSAPQYGEIVFGNSMSGIKGFFTTVRMSTDNATDVGGMKELYAVGTTFVVSSR